jgi:hypothetical protein
LPVVSRQRLQSSSLDAAGVSLSVGDVVGRLSPVLLDLVAAPAGTDAPARRAVIVSPGDEATMLTPGDIVLLVGGTPDSHESSAAIAAATRAGATAVIMKLSADKYENARRVAHEQNVAIVAAPNSADWGQVFTLVRTAIGVTPASAALDSGPADLFALANAIAVATGGATTIEDLQLRVVAYSNLDQPIDDVRRDSILGRSVPTYVMQRDDMVEMYRRLWVDTDIVRLPAEDDGRVRPRLGAVVRADGEAIGTIWVVQGDRPFDTEAETALADSTRRAALLLLQHQEAGDIERRRRADAVRAALDTGAPLPVELGDDERIRVVAFCTAVTGPVDAAARVVRRQRLVDLVAMQLELLDERSAAIDTGDVVLALVPEASALGPRRQREMVVGIVQRASHALKADVIAGIGGVATEPDALATARWEAEQTAAVLAEGSPVGRSSQVASIDDVRSAVVMRRVRQLLAGDERCHTPHLDLLNQHDALHNSDHLATLGAYLDAFGDVAGAARLLDIHPNTLRYRLKRIVELLGVDLTDPVTRFTIELQWRLR